MPEFRISSDYKPCGDQPQAIDKLVNGLNRGFKHQTLLGVTGSGKTFTMANVIERTQKPTLVIAHNKTLAAQLCSEFKEFFPDNAVEYFVSYYDYYQPEAYIPSTDTYIEKDSSINDEIDRLRHSATASLLERRDVIVVASVSCIYGLGDPEDYTDLMLSLRPGMQRDIFIISASDKKKRKGSGKRSRTKTSSLQGRYIRYTFPKGKLKDIAFDATLRAAAPYQKIRDADSVAVCVKSSDFREKVREKRTGSTILFIVDASSSMGARQRMKAVKGAILSILNDAYQKRDKVGMIAFRKDSAQMLLGITRSVDLAEKRLRDLPTGGKTPLASGLYKGYEVIKAAKAKDPDIIPLMVLVSDGRANASINGENPVEEALRAAKIIAAEGIRGVVIDTERDFFRLGLASKIAHAMGAEYIKIDELRQKEIEIAVRSMI